MEFSVNPFYILKATPRTTPDQLAALCQSYSDQKDRIAKDNACQKLINPESRLAAEVAWFFNTSTAEAEAVIQKILRPAPEPQFMLQGLALCNALAYSLPHLSSAASIITYVCALIEAFEEAGSNSLLKILNQARQNGKWPEITDSKIVAMALAQRKKRFLQYMIAALDTLDSAILLKVITAITEKCTKNGRRACPPLLEALVDYYEFEAGLLLQLEEDNLHALLDRYYTLPLQTHPRLLQMLQKVCENYARAMAPVTLKAKSLGLICGKNIRMANRLRNFALGQTPVAREILALIPAYFPESLQEHELAASRLKAADGYGQH